MPPEIHPDRNGYFRTVARQRCPKCTRGLVYSHAMNMNTLCPVCGSRFDREPGYFTGAIYIGILLAIPPVLLLLYLLLKFFPSIPLQLSAVLAVLGFIPLLPLTLRLSRVMWLGIAHDFSPDHYPGSPPEPPAEEPAPVPDPAGGNHDDPLQSVEEIDRPESAEVDRDRQVRERA